MMKLFAKLKPEFPALLIIIVFFAVFFWPATLTGRFFVSGDAIVYSYPLRTIAWEAIRHGSLPLWTPALLSGYPLLSMAQLGIGYPLTWGYLFLSGHAAEQVYVLAPYLLAPAFTYAYARQIGRSRLASLLAGFSFGFGGMMVSPLGTYGFLPNAVMWLPLTLIAIERSLKGRFIPCLLGMTVAYSMALVTGIGQGFTYVGFFAIAYAVFLSVAMQRESPLFAWRRWRPLATCLGGIALAAGVAAFQILESMRAQRRSVRSSLTYEVFSGGAFSPIMTWKSFIAPFHNFLEVSAYVVPLAALCVLCAIVTAVRRPRHDGRLLFWLGAAVLSYLLMLGDQTPLYRLAYHLPFFNLFRVPSRHAFEWTFSLAVLSAYGWDACREFFLARKTGPSLSRRDAVVATGLLALSVAIGIAWWRATRPVAGSAIQYTGLSEPAWLVWKAGFTVSILLATIRSAQVAASRWRGALLSGALLTACFVEPYIMHSRLWFPFTRPASYFTQTAPSSRFLQNYAPEQNRIYTSMANNFFLDLPRAEPHNLSARRGFHNAAGYEPITFERYARVFGALGAPSFSSAPDPQVFSPRWQVLDLLNVRFLVEYSGPIHGATMKKDGVTFSVADSMSNLKPGASVQLTGSPVPVDSLSLVSNLANSSGLAQGETVAKLIVHTADGRAVEREVRAGVDAAEWAHERADVKPVIRHTLAPVFSAQPGDDQNSFPSYRYWSRIELGAKTAVDRVELISQSREATLLIWRVTLYDSATSAASLLTQRLPEHWRKVYDHDRVQIYENGRVAPRVWLAPRAEAVSAEEALRRVRGEGGEENNGGKGEAVFNPRETALLEIAPEELGQLSGGEFKSGAGARIVGYEPDRLVIETEADRPSALVVSEINYPGWVATVDGQRATIHTANYLLRG
ncbi:MAG: hypothetical protein ACREAM_00925, partial [Blastocatellia bacterium]